MANIDYTNFANIIDEARLVYKNTREERFSALQSLYQLYLKAKSDAELEKRIDEEYKLRKIKVRTKFLSNKIAYLTFSDDKRRVSEVHLIFTLAVTLQIEGSEFSVWLKKFGSLSNALKKLRESESSQTSDPAQEKLMLIEKIIANIFKYSDKTTILTDSTFLMDIAVGEKALLAVERCADGTYKCVKMETNNGTADFVSMQHNAQNDDATDVETDWVSQAQLIKAA